MKGEPFTPLYVQVEGAPLELCALVDSDPMAAVTWYKNDLIFMDDARYV